MKKIIIIGAGIAGLTAGCYGQLNGYATEIYELHTLPGGLCTAWDRKGYRIDGCIHWLMGVNPESLFHNVWQGMGVLEGQEFLRQEYIMQIENKLGQKLILYSDIDRLETHLLKLSPSDAEPIRELTEAVRHFKDIRTASRDARFLPYFRLTVGEFAAKFADPFLREALVTFTGKDCPVFSLIFQLAIYNNQDACWPVGGSLAFARSLERRYRELGGKIFYRSRVEEITVTDNRATGVRLADGSIHAADYVISAADGYETIFKLLQGRYLDAEIKALYDSKKVTRPSVQVSLGINADLSRYPYCSNLILEKPVRIGSQEVSSLVIKHYCYDPTLCPPQKSVVTALIPTDYPYWEERCQNRAAYRAEKDRIAAWLIALLADRYPETRGQIEMVDVATPMTYTRYTEVWQGAYSGWSRPAQKIPNVLPGLAGFYMAGQWTQTAGGIPTAAITGQGSIMRICREDQAAETAQA